MSYAFIRKTLAEHSVLKGAPDRAREALAARAVVRSLDAGQLLCGESLRTGRVWFVADGLLHATIHSKKGRPVTVDVLRPGEAYGYVNCWAAGGLAGHAEDVAGLVRSRVVGVPARGFTDLVESNAAVAQAALEAVSDRVHALMRLRAISTEPSLERVRSVLVFLHDKLGPRIPMTRPMIAMVAGLTTETVSRAMAPLRRKRVIALRRGVVEIVDRGGL